MSAIVSAGQVVKTYSYDPYGIEKKPDPTDTNPFRYCGEYYDDETQNIYLRNRYYDQATGRFITEDPACDGMNWYVYCGNNPINKIDPLGLFDYNTRLSYNQTYNEDVEVLQNELVWLGYMDRPADGDWGYFGPKTQAAVNAYKNNMGFGNTGNDKGVVGLQTWTSLGLIYRTQDDINAGVKIVMVGGRHQYFDISSPLNEKLYAEGVVAESKWAIDIPWFISRVDNDADWDIKRPEPWKRTLGITYPGGPTSLVVVNDELITIEKLGNVTYGYIGAALGLPLTILKAGSIAVAQPGFGLSDGSKAKWANEFSDHPAIEKGFNWYKGK